MIEIVLLGPPYLRRDDGVICPACDRSLELMAYLVSRPGRVDARERIAQALWPDAPEKRQRGCLSTALWRLRAALDDAGVNPAQVLSATPTRVGVVQDSPVRLDVDSLRAAFRLLRDRRGADLSETDVAQLGAATRLWQGGFLPGLDSDWALIERESLVVAYQAILDRLLDYHLGRGQWRRALDCAHDLLALDPLLEHAHRVAIKAHGMLGERSLARDQFNKCSRLLMQDLGVQPLPETVEAKDAALGAGGSRTREGPGQSVPELAGLKQLLEEIEGVTRRLEHLVRHC